MEEDQNSILKFFSKFPIKRYARGEIIVRSGETLESVYFLISGIGRVFYLDENGYELTINLLKPKGIYPLSSILAGKSSVYDFQAFSEIEVNKAPVNEVMRYIDTENSFKNILLRNFARGLEGYLVRSFFLIKGTAMQKVASTILILFSRFGKEAGGNRIIDLPLTHQDIANLSGITRETASIQLEILEKEDLIQRNGKKITILNYELLSDKARLGDDGSLLNLSF